MATVSGEKAILKEFPAEQAGELVGWVFTVASETSGVTGGVAYAKVSPNGGAVSSENLGSDRWNWPRTEGLEDRISVGFQVGEEEDVYKLDTFSAPGAPWNRLYTKQGNNLFAFGLERQPIPKSGEWYETGKWYDGGEAILAGIREQLKQNQADWFYSTLYHTLALAANEQSMLVAPVMRGETSHAIANLLAYNQKIGEIQIADKFMKHELSVFGKTPAHQISGTYLDSRGYVKDLNSGLERLANQATLGWFIRHHQLNSRLSRGEDDFGPISALGQKDVEPIVGFLNAEIEKINCQIQKVEPMIKRLTLLHELEVANDKL